MSDINQYTLTSKYLTRHWNISEKKRHDLASSVVMSALFRLESIHNSVKFSIEYTLYRIAYSFDIFNQPYPPFSQYLNRDPSCDVNAAVKAAGDDTPIGGFYKAWLATADEPGLFPLAYKFLVDYGWYTKVYNACLVGPQASSYLRAAGASHDLVKSCNAICNLDLRKTLCIITECDSSSVNVVELNAKLNLLTELNDLDNFASSEHTLIQNWF